MGDDGELDIAPIDGESVNEAGDADPARREEPVADRAEVRDFRRPCAEDGLPG